MFGAVLGTLMYFALIGNHWPIENYGVMDDIKTTQF